MANISAKDVQELRAKTGCGMMDCKKALVEAGGSVEEAIKLLREKGMATAVKKADRIASDGVVAMYQDTDANVSVIIEINSETDFVAKNAEFMAFVEGTLRTVANVRPCCVEKLMETPFDGGSDTVEAKRIEKVQTIGENINVRRFDVFEGNVVTYNHHNANKIGVMVAFEGDASNADAVAFAKTIAMQVAASAPQYLSKEDVPAEVIASEKEILLNQARNDEKNAGKPEAILEKMVMGRLGKYYEQNCLLEQGYIMDDSMKVGKAVEEKAKELGNFRITKFVRYEKGEGMAKREDNFGDEIASMINK